MIDEAILALRSPKTQERIDAAILLGNRRAVEAVPALIEALQDTETHVCWAAIEALGKIGEPALPQLIDILRHHQDYSVRFAITITLGKIHNHASVQALIAALDDEHTSVQQSAADALRQIGTEAALAAIEQWQT